MWVGCEPAMRLMLYFTASSTMRAQNGAVYSLSERIESAGDSGWFSMLSSCRVNSSGNTTKSAP
jgi:hypothetical protein